MKADIQQLVAAALERIATEGVIPGDAVPVPVIERTRDPSHGDFATNVAMVLAKAARSRPRDLAQRILEALPESDTVERVDIAGPGFINFHLSPGAYLGLLPRIIEQGLEHRKSRGRIVP